MSSLGELHSLAGLAHSLARQSAGGLMKSDRTLIKDQRRAYEILQELMEEFTRSDSEFRQIGEVLAELKYRLDNFKEED